jgi:GDP-L-fucose synthase
MKRESKIIVLGHRGLVGSAIVTKLYLGGYANLEVKTRLDIDLRNRNEVDQWFKESKPEYVFLAAAKVGGIVANSTYPADFIYDNLMIQTNVIDSSYRNGVKKLLFLGSSCIYPKECPQPIKEDYLLTGPLESTNNAYAIAKIAGIKMIQSYAKQYGFNGICLMPTNLFGPNDNFDLETSHLLPALIRKLHEAKINGDKQVVMWGTGTPRREMLHVDDLADACLFLMNNYDSPDIVNVGTGEDLSILEIAETIKNVVGFDGEIVTDTSKPDGTMRKILDVSKINELGWKSKIRLEDGVKSTYQWYKNKLGIILE